MDDGQTLGTLETLGHAQCFLASMSASRQEPHPTTFDIWCVVWMYR